MKKHALALFAGLLLSFAFAPGALGSQCEADLEDRADVSAANNPAGYDFDIYYTNDVPTSSDFASTTEANLVRDVTALAHPALLAAPLSFKDPPYAGESPQDVCIFDTGKSIDARAFSTHMEVQSTKVSGWTEIYARVVMLHEMFHHVQYASVESSWGAWLMEGTANYIEDKAFLDHDLAVLGGGFVPNSNKYLADPNRTLTDIAYDAGLFWNYLAEQVGSPLAEPAYGVDFLKRFLDLAEGRSPDTIGTIRDTLDDFNEDRSLESLFTDFQIANYTHRLDVSALANPSRYVFYDESAAGGGVALNTVTTTAVPAGGVQNDGVDRWGALHFETTLDRDQECEVLGFYGQADPGVELGWALVSVDVVGGPDRALEVQQARGNVFYSAMIQTPSDEVDKLGFIVTGLHTGSAFDYAFDAGPATGSVIWPIQERVVRVGEIDDPPERFLVRLLVEGPAALTPEGFGKVSVKGLDATLFEVDLRSTTTGAVYNAPTILSSRYVDGEYWLTVQAPEITDPVDGTLYDLEVCFCRVPGGASCAAGMTSPASVRYENEIVNQVLTVDRSYSMHHPQPAETAKITAAKNAARMYVDAANDDDWMTVVTFTGDNNECNHDAQTQPASGGLIKVAGNQATLLADVNAIVEDGWTSIGDGLKQAAGELAGVGAPDDVRAIVLMSDGLENEGDFWAQNNASCGTPAVRDNFNPDLGGAWADIRIDTIAFGADADQNLLQQIADFTNGIALPVSTAAPSAAANVPSSSAAAGGLTLSPNPLALEVPNRLANAYRSIQENVGGQDRFYTGAKTLAVGAPQNFPIEVTESAGGGVADASFAVNWDMDAATVSVELYDPSNSLVNTTTAGWSINNATTNKTYRYSGTLGTGNWRIILTANAATQATVTLSGKIVRGVTLDAELSQVRQDAPHGECRNGHWKYLRGLPVTVLAVLTDSNGAIAGLEARAQIANPDGSVNKLNLYDDGAHDDGAPGDGVYGNRYTKTPFWSRGGVPDYPDGPPSGDWGSYSVLVDAAGQSNFGENFSRSQERGFHVTEFDPLSGLCDSDKDNDGLPDRWEDLYGLDSTDPGDGITDPDLDGLNNKEEFLAGTLPLDADTDNGGESDGSEVSGGRDPIFDDDDLLPAILDYGIITRTYHEPVHEPQPETLILRFPVHANYDTMHIFRRDAGAGNFVRIDSVDLAIDDSAVYDDKNLTNGTLYEYRFQAEGLSNSLTALTEIVSGIPKADPVAPGLVLLINGGHPETGTVDALLQLDASTDTVEMKVSQDASFGGLAWSPYSPTLPFTLVPAGSGAVPVTVYARVRDAAGNESLTMSAVVVVDLSSDTDGDGAPNETDSDDDEDGLSDADEINIHGTDPLSADTDGDGLSDADEINTHGTDPLQTDSDNDSFSDQAEIAAGSDPLDPESTPVSGLPGLSFWGLAALVLALALVALAVVGSKRRRGPGATAA